ncbi:SDR family NAD(P)-dependent oxidoreductase [Chenggangzhangella methanolivorans]|uniref:SDR family NAD(P)-dependent oxidoreductase n=1 Tax=Chenggangzhangella methanolivorans TaxID=1437009 RepID=A0A9E6REB0_9HYPH|nr:SDR family NAD(P)-dependent oxidoreductase [Chenggangzhangella methanolivorans]QZO02460.1 SDR family NAD(P)-dependent oxidoreductase [Chenggangzhangella methanolivorans]
MGNKTAGGRRPLAVVTGASSGIGLELARECVDGGFDLVVASDDGEIDAAAGFFRERGADVTAITADLSTADGVEALISAIDGRPVDALLANAGRALGKAFLDQDFDRVRGLVDTNVTGTLHLIHRVGQGMRSRRSGRILITGSIGGYVPGPFDAVYDATKAFLNNFSFALRHELKDENVTVTVLMPGPTETAIFERGDLGDTKAGVMKKDDAAEVAATGFKAMMAGDGDVASGLKAKLISAAANVVPSSVLAAAHAKGAKPWSGR